MGWWRAAQLPATNPPPPTEMHSALSPI